MKNLSHKELGPVGHRKRLRERFTKAGRPGLADYELMELLLTYAIPRSDTKPIAKDLLHRFGTIFSVLQQDGEELTKTKGVGPETAIFLSIVRACLTRSMESAVERRQSISGPEDLFAFTRLHVGSRADECIYAIYLNDAKHVVHHEEVTVGTVDRVSLYPRELVKSALKHNATGMILVHNHPDGQPVPSEHDLEMTAKLEDLIAEFGIMYDRPDLICYFL
jgi:DNA repair protein RadC